MANSKELCVIIDRKFIRESIKGLKAIRREAREAIKELKTLEVSTEDFDKND